MKRRCSQPDGADMTRAGGALKPTDMSRTCLGHVSDMTRAGRRGDAGEQVVEDKGGVGEDWKDGVEGVVEVRRPLDQCLEGHRLGLGSG